MVMRPFGEDHRCEDRRGHRLCGSVDPLPCALGGMVEAVEVSRGGQSMGVQTDRSGMREKACDPYIPNAHTWNSTNQVSLWRRQVDGPLLRVPWPDAMYCTTRRSPHMSTKMDSPLAAVAMTQVTPHHSAYGSLARSNQVLG